MNQNKEELINKLKQLEKEFNTQVADIKKQIEERIFGKHETIIVNFESVK